MRDLFKIQLIVILLTLIYNIRLEASELDSLKKIVPGLNGNEKVDALNRLSWHLKTSNPDTAIFLAKQSIQISDSIEYINGLGTARLNLAIFYTIQTNFTLSDSLANKAIGSFKQTENVIGIAKCWNVLGLNHNNRANYDSALFFLRKSLFQFKTVGNELSILKIEANIGNINYYIGQYDSAMIAYQNIVNYARKVKDSVSLKINLQNVGNVYSELGDYSNAIKTYFEVVEISELLNDSISSATNNHAIALTFNRIEMYEEAIAYVRKAIRILKSVKNQRILGSAQITLANAIKELGDLDSAYYYYHLALKNYEAVGNRDFSTVYGNIGKVYSEWEDFEKAESYYKNAIKIDEDLGDQNGLARHQSYLGELYLNLVRTEEAKSLLIASLTYKVEQGKLKETSLTAEVLSKVYEQLNDHKLALYYLDLSKTYKDSALGSLKQVELVRTLVQEKLKENKSTITHISNKEEDNSQSELIFLVLGLVLVISFVLYIAKHQKIKLLQSSLIQKDRELAFLSLGTVQKDEFISRFKDQLQSIVNSYPENPVLQKLNKEIKLKSIETNQWDHFKRTFEQIAPQFFDRLLSTYPNLSDKELRLCALIRLNIPIQEVAKLQGISISSVNKARYRLRKRFSIEGRRSLENFIMSI